MKWSEIRFRLASRRNEVPDEIEPDRKFDKKVATKSAD